jgi:hypothetical protein
MGSLGRKMNAYDRRIKTLLDSESDALEPERDAELLRIGDERYDLQVRVVEPMLRRYMQHQEHEDNRRNALNEETEFPEPPDEIDEDLWKSLHWYGRRGADDRRRRRAIYDTTLTEFTKAEEEAASELARIRWPHYVLLTLLAAQQHVVVAHTIAGMLPEESRPPRRVDPQMLMDLLGGLAGTQFWEGTPRPEQAIADCATFLLEWFQVGPTAERYHEILVERVASASDVGTLLSVARRSDANRPERWRLFHISAPLPTLREAAAALEARASRARDMAALARFASQGAALVTSSRHVGGWAVERERACA